MLVNGTTNSNGSKTYSAYEHGKVLDFVVVDPQCSKQRVVLKGDVRCQFVSVQDESLNDDKAFQAATTDSVSASQAEVP